LLGGKPASRGLVLGAGGRAIQGANLFTTPDALARLVAADGAPLEGCVSIVFSALGQVVVDFDSDQEAPRRFMCSSGEMGCDDAP